MSMSEPVRKLGKNQIKKKKCLDSLAVTWCLLFAVRSSLVLSLPPFPFRHIYSHVNQSRSSHSERGNRFVGKKAKELWDKNQLQILELLWYSWGDRAMASLSNVELKLCSCFVFFSVCKL